jgi:hypothetical protein
MSTIFFQSSNMANLLHPRDAGMSSGSSIAYKTALVVAVFLALAVYNTTEILVKIFRRFRRCRGVYFYSMLAASIGIIIHALGYFLRNYNISRSPPLEITLACGGGMLMITGQSIVLWSRLHLISPGKWPVHLPDVHTHAFVRRIPWSGLQDGVPPPHPREHSRHLARHHHPCLPIHWLVRDPDILENTGIQHQVEFRVRHTSSACRLHEARVEWARTLRPQAYRWYDKRTWHDARLGARNHRSAHEWFMFQQRRVRAHR